MVIPSGISELKFEDALRAAHDQGLDLVEVSVSDDGVPVCKILNYGKVKYEAEKRAREAHKNIVEVKKKEIQLSNKIADHDLEHKIRQVEKFLGDGCVVKIVVKFKGREETHLDLGMNILRRVAEAVSSVSKLDAKPTYDMHQLFVILSPK